MRRIAAVLLLCALLPLWAAGCGGQPSSGEQALSVLIDSEADSSFGPFLRDGLPALLDMPVEVTVLPVGDGASQAEMEELEAQRTRVRTQLMSGSGPDLLVLNNRMPTLLDDPVKTMDAGAFLDLAPHMEQLSAGLSLHPAVLAAGQWDGAQYLLPLTFTLPAVLADAGALADFAPPRDDVPAAFLRALMAHTGAEDLTPLVYLQSGYGDCFTAAPVLDYAAGRVHLNEDQLALAELLAQVNAMGFTGSINAIFPEGGAPFAAALLGENMFRQWAEALVQAGGRPALLPVPNGEGGVTGAVALYAGIRANSPLADRALQALGALLQPEAFQHNAAGQQVLNAGASLALARETTETLLAKTFGADSPLAAQYLDAAARVDTARFCYLGSRALYRYVVYPLATGQATAARGAEDLAAAYRYYFSE